MNLELCQAKQLRIGIEPNFEISAVVKGANKWRHELLRL